MPKAGCFPKETQIVVLSHHGGGILAKNIFAAQQKLILRSLESNREAAIRILVR